MHTLQAVQPPTKTEMPPPARDCTTHVTISLTISPESILDGSTENRSTRLVPRNFPLHSHEEGHRRSGRQRSVSGPSALAPVPMQDFREAPTHDPARFTSTTVKPYRCDVKCAFPAQWNWRVGSTGMRYEVCGL